MPEGWAWASEKLQNEKNANMQNADTKADSKHPPQLFTPS